MDAHIKAFFKVSKVITHSSVIQMLYHAAPVDTEALLSPPCVQFCSSLGLKFHMGKLKR